MRFQTKLIFIISLLTVCSCSKPSKSCRELIKTADSLISHSPDSAITILDRLDMNRLGKDEAYIYYLKGKANLNLNNYPEAMESLLQAEKLSESMGNDSLLALSRRGMMDLSDSIYDINEKARYAIKACDVYEKYNDYDNIYDILSRFILQACINERPYKYADDHST